MNTIQESSKQEDLPDMSVKPLASWPLRAIIDWEIKASQPLLVLFCIIQKMALIYVCDKDILDNATEIRCTVICSPYEKLH